LTRGALLWPAKRASAQQKNHHKSLQTKFPNSLLDVQDSESLGRSQTKNYQQTPKQFLTRGINRAEIFPPARKKIQQQQKQFPFSGNLQPSFDRKYPCIEITRNRHAFGSPLQKNKAGVHARQIIQNRCFTRLIINPMTDLLLLVAFVLVSAWALGYLGVYAIQFLYLLLLLILGGLVMLFIGRRFKSTVQSFHHEHGKKNNVLRDRRWQSADE
jgi:hypothetical protein